MTELFGTAAVSAMVICCSLEDRGPSFTLALVGSCLAAAGHALTIGSWPFFVVAVLWAEVAARRAARRLSAARDNPSHMKGNQRWTAPKASCRNRRDSIRQKFALSLRTDSTSDSRWSAIPFNLTQSRLTASETAGGSSSGAHRNWHKTSTISSGSSPNAAEASLSSGSRAKYPDR